MKQKKPANTPAPLLFTMAEVMELLKYKSRQSIRRQIQRTGSYFGIEPMRLANGRLLFPAVKPKADRQARGEE